MSAFGSVTFGQPATSNYNPNRDAEVASVVSESGGPHTSLITVVSCCTRCTAHSCP